MKRIVFILFFLMTVLSLSAQETGRYRVQFTDKNNSVYSVENPEAFLSVKAIERRAKNNVNISAQDFPVNSWYVDSLIVYGAVVCNTSRWFNSVIVVIDSTSNYQKISALPFVQSIERVAPLHKSEPNTKKLYSETIAHTNYGALSNTNPKDFYGRSYNQIQLMQGVGLHKDGYMGQGVTIAVIDAGFVHVDSITAFAHVWQENRFVDIRDFSGAHVCVFEEGYHGMAVFSLIGSFVPGKLVGTAPRANFMLLRSEEGATEYSVEEDNWIAAAEFADSAGVDIITTSLGYSTFDDSTQNYTYAQHDGKTIRISRAANIAASKGILLCNSAGNSGAKPWKYITAPADADSILTVGACTAQGKITSFSSRGPNAAGVLKPEIVAQGFLPAIVTNHGLVEVSGMGTSFSTPIVAGMIACLWQEFPEATAQQIKKAVIQSSHQYFAPDTIYGYGIPNFEKARIILRMNVLESIFEHANFYPNPFNEKLYLDIDAKEKQSIQIHFFDTQGKKIFLKNIDIQSLINTFEIPEVQTLATGTYIAVISSGKHHQIYKVVKQL